MASAGLSLNAGARGGLAFAPTNGSYGPLTPASASSPTAPIAQQAYGINGSGGKYNAGVTAWGSVGIGALSIAALIYLWWSLPR